MRPAANREYLFLESVEVQRSPPVALPPTHKKKKENKMNPSTKCMALVQIAKKTGQVLVIVSVLTLLLLIAGGAGLFHPPSSQAGVLIAGSTGDIYVGSGG